jgi:hypothetical protein
MNRVIRAKIIRVLWGLSVIHLAGCMSQRDATCPLPQDGVCAPIHVVDAALYTPPPHHFTSLLVNRTQNTHQDGLDNVRWHTTTDHRNGGAE